MNSLNSVRFHQHAFISAAAAAYPQGAFIMDACPVTALGVKKMLVESAGITGPFTYVQSLAAIPEKIADAPPALLIMDICGEKESVLDGLRLLSQIVASSPAMKIVICTDYSDHRILELLASSGAHGLLLKNEPVLALEQCVTEVLAGATQWLSPRARQILSGARQTTPLTARELDVLAYLFSGLSVSRVAQTLHRDIRTVSTHKRNAMMKLGFHNDSELFAQGTWMAKIGPSAIM
ncbi:response regulator transcription factor [Rahnella sp. PD12R]|uniref:response regulator transcription factor n=1 Tax=Rahnella sp. PD12R TaxID=2855688 RepID=UPI002104FF6A|nr:response regulator transcription factor [Rahnella sp. PD12R]